MLQYIARRFMIMIPTLVVVSMVVFFIIQLPPGDYLQQIIANRTQGGETVDMEEILALKNRYGLDQPIYVQYMKWVRSIFRGDWGISFQWNRPVSELMWDRLGYTLAIALSALAVNWLFAFPIGIYSAVRQYSAGDYFFTGVAFISSATPHFLVALVLMYTVWKWTGFNITGLYSSEFADTPMSFAKFVDILKHIGPALFILGFLGGAGLIRTMRANMLDELHKPYVTTARAKGLTERRVIMKYPVRVALNPFVSTVGWTLPRLISGTTIVSIVLGLPTTGPLLLKALKGQDMYLAGSFLLILSFLTVLGTFLSDLALAALDPRIRYE
jgi:peptide/nickel transport system permease protein